MPATFWERTRWGGKAGFDKLYGLVDKLGAPVNKLTNKLGSEAFWPTTLDKESDKAARILRSFCKDGFYEEEDRPSAEGPKQKQKVLKKIPAEVIRNAKGLAIFTTMRTGLWMSGAGGSGVLIGRTADGSWSPPSGIMLHTAGIGFLVGVDIYDCVVVINTQAGLDAFSRLRCTLGGEVSAVAGPVGAGGVLETEIHKRQAPVFTYLKSRGFYAGVQIDGTVVIERHDENERFYGEKISVGDIMAGKVRHPPPEIKRLLETVRAAQGDMDIDESIVPSEPPPSDYELDENGHTFGIPDKDDPDPYGVLQLEKEGMVIREAGTQKRASWEQFTFAPSPTSPLFGTFDRRRESQTMNGASRRTSQLSGTTVQNGRSSEDSGKEKEKPPVQMSDMATQTDLPPPPASPSRSSIRSIGHRISMNNIPEDDVAPISPTGTTSARISRKVSGRSTVSRTSTPPKASPVEEGASSPSPTPAAKNLHNTDGDVSATDLNDADDEDTADDAENVIEEPIVHTVQQATKPQVITRARLVTVPKRAPPVLPPRNPNRGRGPLIIDAETGEMDDGISDGSVSPIVSPVSANATPTSPTKSGLEWPRAQSETEARLGAMRLNSIDASTDGDDTVVERNPWAKIMEKRSTSSGSQDDGRNSSQVSLEVPGTFHSYPTTPEPEEAAMEEVKL